jgi:hypothetical protein
LISINNNIYYLEGDLLNNYQVKIKNKTDSTTINEISLEQGQVQLYLNCIYNKTFNDDK